MSKLSKDTLKQYYSSIGILLTELIIFSTPIRFPVLLFLQQIFDYKTLKPAFITILFAILYFYILGISRETLLVSSILLGSFVFVNSRNWGINFAKTSTQILILLLLVSIIQVTFGIELGNFFSDYYDKFVGKAAGFSAEPSFFAWVFIYFWLSRFCEKGLDLFSVFALISALVLTNAFTIVAFMMIFTAIYILLKLIENKFIALAILVFAFHAIPLILISYKLPFFDYMLILTGSWREPSHFASFLSSQPLGPFSGGANWAPDVIAGLDKIYLESYPFWIEWPWSFSSILALEFGYLITFCICLILVWMSSKNRFNNYRHNVAWVLFIFIALFVAPKWMVFFFFFPFSDKNSK